ncbi:hypothetical protein ACUXQ2_006208 [Cupriavidus metallidurans]
MLGDPYLILCVLDKYGYHAQAESTTIKRKCFMWHFFGDGQLMGT